MNDGEKRAIQILFGIDDECEIDNFILQRLGEVISGDNFIENYILSVTRKINRIYTI